MYARRLPGALVSPLKQDIRRLAIASYRQARRAVILLIGSSVLVIGAAMILLPGPAFIVIPLGLTILSIEFAWARRWLKEMRARVQEAREKAGSAFRNRPQD